MSLLIILEHLQKLLGTNLVPQMEAARAGDVRDSLADISLAERVLKYAPTVGLEEGLRQTTAYYRDGR